VSTVATLGPTAAAAAATAAAAAAAAAEAATTPSPSQDRLGRLVIAGVVGKRVRAVILSAVRLRLGLSDVLVGASAQSSFRHRRRRVVAIAVTVAITVAGTGTGTLYFCCFPLHALAA
jgi:hypothetical protein